MLKVIDDYKEKGYISKVDESDTKEKLHLPHFPVIKPDRETTKVGVVFDASVKENGTSMNDIIYTGPKLQRDLVEVLLRFRRFPVALVCDVVQIYLHIGIAPKDQSYHRFVWRDLNQNQVPDHYEFNRLVFGVNSCPFQAQFVTQHSVHWGITAHAPKKYHPLFLAKPRPLKSANYQSPLFRYPPLYVGFS